MITILTVAMLSITFFYELVYYYSETFKIGNFF